MTSRVVVLADDLTGAADTAAQFDRAGWSAELLVGSGGPSDAEVLAVNTGSRALGPAAAAEAVRTALATVAPGEAAVYLKIDSTLRGPVRATVEALVAAQGDEVVAVVCPAFPAVGRTLAAGVLKVNGVPVAQTAVGSDPVTPVRESHLPTLLGAPLVELDPQASDAELAVALRGHGPVVVVDARDEADLERVARAVIALGNQAVAVGSAGLAAHLARRWRPLRPGTALVVVSSLHDVSLAQANALAAAGARRFSPEPAMLRETAAWEQFTRTVVSEVASGDSATVLLTGPDGSGPAVEPSVVAQRLGELAALLVAVRRTAGLVLAGGDGALAVLTALGATGVRLNGQVADGVPLGRLVGGPQAGLPVATKAGGFGDETILIRAAQAVRSTKEL